MVWWTNHVAEPEIKSAPVGVRNLWDMFSSDKLVAVIILGGAKRNQATITI